MSHGINVHEKVKYIEGIMEEEMPVKTGSVSSNGHLQPIMRENTD
jgi:hypothetical protein